MAADRADDWRLDGHASEPLPLVTELVAAAEITRLRDNLQAIADRGYCEEFGCLECKSVRIAVMALAWDDGQVAT